MKTHQFGFLIAVIGFLLGQVMRISVKLTRIIELLEGLK